MYVILCHRLYLAKSSQNIGYMCTMYIYTYDMCVCIRIRVCVRVCV